MALKKALGNIKTVKIFFNDKKGEVRLKTDQGDLILGLTNDNISTFCAMASVASSAMQFGNLAAPGNKPNVRVEYEDSTKEISWMEYSWISPIVLPP